MELSLNPETGLRESLVEIDLQGMRQAGYQIPQITRVTGNVFGMPGGGYEMKLDYEIPKGFLRVIK